MLVHTSPGQIMSSGRVYTKDSIWVGYVGNEFLCQQCSWSGLIYNIFSMPGSAVPGGSMLIFFWLHRDKEIECVRQSGR